MWTQCYVILTVLNVCTSIGWIIFSHSYLHVTHDKISVCLAIWLIWWTHIFVIKMINTPGHVLSPGWPLCKRSGLTLIEVSQHAYSSYQASSLPFIFYHVILATWCNWLDFYWCWIKFCLSLSLSLSLSLKRTEPISNLSVMVSGYEYSFQHVDFTFRGNKKMYAYYKRWHQNNTTVDIIHQHFQFDYSQLSKWYAISWNLIGHFE